jgi:hypothetical protein
MMPTNDPGSTSRKEFRISLLQQSPLPGAAEVQPEAQPQKEET